MNSRIASLVALLVLICCAGSGLSTAAGASSASVAKQCGAGRRPSYVLRPSDTAFLRRYLRCVLKKDGLTHPSTDTVHITGKPISSGAVGGNQSIPVKFAKYMAPTVAKFAKAPRSAKNWHYINAKLQAAYDKLEEQPFPGQWTAFGDTTAPSPTLKEIAGALAPARKSVDQFVRHGFHARLAIDVVVQKGVWFHGGRGNHLRYMILLKAA